MKALILGSGVSVNDHDPGVYWQFPLTIGVNQICRLFTPNYVTMLDPPSTFGEEGMPWAEKAAEQARCVVQQNRLWEWQQYFPSADLLGYALMGVDDDEWKKYEPSYYRPFLNYWLNQRLVLPCAPTSVGVATWFAVSVGATEIGIIGLDYTKGYFYDEDKELPGADANAVDKLFAGMADVAKEIFNVNIYNLSPESKIRSLNQKKLEDL